MTVNIEIAEPPQNSIMDVLCHYFSTSQEYLFSGSKKSNCIYYTSVFFYLLRYELGMPFSTIEDLYGFKRTTIQERVNRIDRERAIYWRVAHDIRNLSNAVNNLQKLIK